MTQRRSTIDDASEYYGSRARGEECEFPLLSRDENNRSLTRGILDFRPASVHRLVFLVIVCIPVIVLDFVCGHSSWGGR